MSFHPMRFLLDDERHDDGPIFPHKNHYDLNSKIMLTAIISLSVVVLLVIVLHTYARCVLRRQALRRRAVLRQMNSMAHVHSAEPPKTGLEPSVIALLPTFVFRRVEGREGGDGDVEASSAIECAVCLSVLVEEEMARLLPNCKHTFHAECIDTWLNSHTTCPICRTEAQPQRVPQPEPREGPVATVVSPTAPLLDRVNSGLSCMEGTSGGGAGGAADAQSCGKVMNGSTSRLGSFRRMLSREKSSRRMVQSCGQEDGIEDLERVNIIG